MRRTDGTDGRGARAARTRATVVEAATRLFVERGYTATTIEDVAASAGVAVQTIYYAFGNKRTLLGAVLDASIAGDLEPLPVLDRPWVTRLRGERDPAVVVGSLVRETVRIVARATPIYEVIRRASADPEVGAVLQRNREARRVAQRGFVQILHDGGHLAPDVDLDTAADVYYALLNEEVFQLLVDVCGWDVERVASWATSLMVEQLVAGTASAADGR